VRKQQRKGFDSLVVWFAWSFGRFGERGICGSVRFALQPVAMSAKKFG
jgi:hypothetical protein